jgi:transposase
VRRAGLTLAGNRRARRVLIEGAWTYRYPARVSETLYQDSLIITHEPRRAIRWT